MNLKKVKWAVIICTLFITFALVQSAAAEKVLRVGVSNTLGTLDPAFWQNSTESLIMSAIHPKLINYKPADKWVYENELAESIELVDPTTIKSHFPRIKNTTFSEFILTAKATSNIRSLQYLTDPI